MVDSCAKGAVEWEGDNRRRKRRENEREGIESWRLRVHNVGGIVTVTFLASDSKVEETVVVDADFRTYSKYPPANPLVIHAAKMAANPTT